MPLFCEQTLQPLSHVGQGLLVVFHNREVVVRAPVAGWGLPRGPVGGRHWFAAPQASVTCIGSEFGAMGLTA